MVMMDMDYPIREDAVMGGAQPEQFMGANGFIDPRNLQAHPEPTIAVHQDVFEDMPDVIREDEEYAQSDSAEVNRRLLPTGVCYDERMTLHANADFSIEPHHPEDPRRIQAIFAKLRAHGLIYSGDQAKLDEILLHSPTRFMYRIEARQATKKEICLVHKAEHFDWVENTSRMESEDLRELSKDLDQGITSIYVGNFSYDAALVSAGSAIETCKHVVEGNVKNAMAIIRPPGHHAESDAPMGFCFFNNVPIAARVCQHDYNSCRKVLILDWDVHHGNGTQHMFYDDPNVLYISLHVWQHGKFYPSMPENKRLSHGGLDQVGEGRGVGKNVNIPWETQGMGDGEYMAAFQRIVMPIAQEFNPDLVIISAGFDAAEGDQLGLCHVTPACYSHMTHMLMSLAGGRVAVCLEGGYNLTAISRSALAVAQTLMGEPPRPMNLAPIHEVALNVLKQVREAQSPHWECMRPAKPDVVNIKREEGVQLDTVIRAWQYLNLRKSHNMLEMVVAREDLATIMANQILYTPKITKAEKIFVIVHEPVNVKPDHNDITDQNIDAKDIWVTDPVRPFIDWVAKRGYGIIDINIPTSINEVSDVDGSDGEQSPKIVDPIVLRKRRIQEATEFIWNNYLGEHKTESIVFMCVGDAYGAIRELLFTKPEARHKISAILAFVTGSLIPVTLPSAHPDGDGLEKWYGENSWIFAAHDHAVWQSEKLIKRIRKRGKWGNVKRSNKNDLNEMMKEAFNDSLNWADAAVTAQEVGEVYDEL